MSKNKYPQKDFKRLYSIYHSMKKRCLNKQSKTYKDYGARGIKICDKWIECTDNFIEWALENGYKDGLTLDRVNPNGNYEPSNCRWATYSQQMCNKRKTKLYTYNGECLSVKEWSDKLGIPYYILYQRLVKLNWEPKRAFFEKNKNEETFKDLCREHGLSDNTVRTRLYMGWDLNKALNTPTEGMGANWKSYSGADKPWWN